MLGFGNNWTNFKKGVRRLSVDSFCKVVSVRVANVVAHHNELLT